MNLDTEVLKQILVTSGYIEPLEFDDASRSASDLGKDLYDVLIFRGLINSDALSKLIAEYLKVPYVDIRHQLIEDSILQLVPEKMARMYKLLPFKREGDQLKVAMVNPSDVEAIEFLKRHTGLIITPYYASDEEIKRALGQYKRNFGVDFERIIAENLKKVGASSEDLTKAAENLPIIKVLDTILEYAVSERASDVHIETQETQVIVRFRVDGLLRDIIKFPRGVEEALVARIKILSNLKLDERRVPQDGRHKFNMGTEPISLRISIIPGFFGENVVMRLLDESSRPLSLEELGVMGRNLDVIKRNFKRPNGMLLVTGPTGSGKTTTLYSVLNILNTIRVKICTIEDPIEYSMPRITQIQVNSKTGVTFAAGLRAFLRHDPDIMMVGEIRDKETAEIAIHAALTGHLVLSTLHTNDAIGAIPRLLDMGVEDYLLASTINVVVAQRLVRKICSSCIAEYKPEEVFLTKLNRDFGVSLENLKFYKGKGCPECKGSGFMGRIGIYEVLEVTDEVRDLVNKGSGAQEILDLAKKQGMISMADDGVNKVAGGLTTIEEVINAIMEG
ncbi:hypothetical protein A2191_01185 [Candidatus Woesebacteria bacterium RIFOXYA1_FULL_38_9]|nr:MAG: hypothetical protein A2191_01185 [Candidatus Woesebacteria bacterium RIFOXYA1_FULL_38_9]